MKKKKRFNHFTKLEVLIIVQMFSGSWKRQRGGCGCDIDLDFPKPGHGGGNWWVQYNGAWGCCLWRD